MTFKEAGLGSNTTVTIRVTAHLDATYSCFNKGGKVPSDPKKTTFSSDLSQSANFTSGKNGSVSGSLSVTGPAPSTVLDCPKGQTATLVSADWSNIVVTDTTNGVSMNL